MIFIYPPTTLHTHLNKILMFLLCGVLKRTPQHVISDEYHVSNVNKLNIVLFLAEHVLLQFSQPQTPQSVKFKLGPV